VHFLAKTYRVYCNPRLVVIVLNWVIFEAMPGVNGALYAVLGRVKAAAERVPASTRSIRTRQALLGPVLRLCQKPSHIPVRVLGPKWPRCHLSNDQHGKLTNTLLLLGVSTMMALLIGTVVGIFVSRRRDQVRHVRNHNVSRDSRSPSVLHRNTPDFPLCWLGKLVPAGRDISQRMGLCRIPFYLGADTGSHSSISSFPL